MEFAKQHGAEIGEKLPKNYTNLILGVFLLSLFPIFRGSDLAISPHFSGVYAPEASGALDEEKPTCKPCCKRLSVGSPSCVALASEGSLGHPELCSRLESALSLHCCRWVGRWCFVWVLVQGL